MFELLELILSLIVFIASVYIIVATLTVKFIDTIKPRQELANERSERPKNVLLVTAHPDDECMFFGPTIITRSSEPIGQSVHLLCLSNGDHYGDGKVREKELDEACRALSMVNCPVDSNDQFEDQPDNWWDESRIAEAVKKTVVKYDISCVITFDDYGISGHLNHRSIYRALPNIRQELPKVEILCLQSISIFRKYLSVFELPISLLNSGIKSSGELNSVSFANYPKLLKALLKHKSQMLWFRYLYCIASRYMFFNQLAPFGQR